MKLINRLREIRVAIFPLAYFIALPMMAQTGAVTGPSFVQRGTGAVSRGIQDKLQDIVSVKDFGAKCDGGKTDDRAAIQAAIDAVGLGTVYLPYPGCGVSAPGVFLYPPNAGITITGLGQISPGAYAPGTGGGLVAYAASPPPTLLTVFAGSARLQNLYLDCNNGAAGHGVVSAMGAFNTWTDVTTRKCSGDGGQVFDEGTPATTLTSSANVGAKSVTVVSMTNNRLTFGTYYCPYIVLDFGTPNAEYNLPISGVSGTTINFSTALTHNHAANSTAQCHGNSDDMHIQRYVSRVNGGWGWNVLPGSDNNGIYWADGTSSGNTLGGELWSGSMGIHVGGNYEGDRGPAVQLGDIAGATTHFMTIGPIGDLEESNVANNAVVAVCDDSSQVQIQLADRLKIQSGAGACPAYANGTTTTGFGTDNNMQLFVKNATGTIAMRPGHSSPGGQGFVYFYDASGAVLNTFGLSGSNGLGAGKPVTDYAHAQLEANGGPASLGDCNDCKVMIGYRTDTREGFIQATVYGSSTSPLTLNPSGGAVSAGPQGGVTAAGLPATCMGGEYRYINDASNPVFGAVATGTGTTHAGGYRMVQCNGNNQWVF